MCSVLTMARVARLGIVCLSIMSSCRISLWPALFPSNSGWMTSGQFIWSMFRAPLIVFSSIVTRTATSNHNWLTGDLSDFQPFRRTTRILPDVGMELCYKMKVLLLSASFTIVGCSTFELYSLKRVGKSICTSCITTCNVGTTVVGVAAL